MAQTNMVLRTFSAVRWLALIDRPLTEDRISSEGSSPTPLWDFCSSEDESQDHIFLSCLVTKNIWQGVLLKLQISRPSGDRASELA